MDCYDRLRKTDETDKLYTYISLLHVYTILFLQRILKIVFVTYIYNLLIKSKNVQGENIYLIGFMYMNVYDNPL